MAKKQRKHKNAKQVQRNVKDRLFRFLFEQNRDGLLELYNALNGTAYQDASQLEIVTIESAVYIVMKNDLAFVLSGTLNLYEHQSTFNPNLPVRFLIYLAQEYQMLLEKAEESVYGAREIMLPTPRCVVFYNGTREMPEEHILKLSDVFCETIQGGDVELTVRMLNINYGYNRELMEKCRILREYSELVQISREYMQKEDNLRKALSNAIDDCIDKGILSEFLRGNRMEVLGMFLEEFDAEKYERSIRREGHDEGHKEGVKEGIRCTIEILQEINQTRDKAKEKMIEKYALSEQEAEQELLLYWK